jgi:hypothetical protein
MSRHITILQRPEHCGWFVIEDGSTTGALSLDEAVAHVAALMLRGWTGFPMESLDAVTTALFRSRLTAPAADAKEAGMIVDVMP